MWKKTVKTKKMIVISSGKPRPHLLSHGLVVMKCVSSVHQKRRVKSEKKEGH